MKITGHLIIIGYGDVGKSIVQVLKNGAFQFVVVDNNEKVFEHADFEYIVGNGTDEEVLITAGVKTASFIFVALNDDTNVIFATLIARGLNPNSMIVARANSIKSIDKIYKAGADYVASLSIVAGQMLAKMTARCIGKACKLDEDIILYEGIEIEKHHVDRASPLYKRSIESLSLEKTIGCIILGIEREGNVITDLTPKTVIQEGDVVAVVGNRKQISEFKEQYL